MAYIFLWSCHLSGSHFHPNSEMFVSSKLLEKSEKKILFVLPDLATTHSPVHNRFELKYFTILYFCAFHHFDYSLGNSVQINIIHFPVSSNVDQDVSFTPLSIDTYHLLLKRLHSFSHHFECLLKII